jgi:hypothetical protein
MLVRTITAFAVAPAIGASLVFLCLLDSPHSLFEAGFLVSMLMIAYPLTLIVGVPLFLWTRSWTNVSIWMYVLLGALVACFAAVPLALAFPASFALIALAAGAVGGLAFGLIARPKSNNRRSGREVN